MISSDPDMIFVVVSFVWPENMLTGTVGGRSGTCGFLVP